MVCHDGADVRVVLGGVKVGRYKCRLGVTANVTCPSAVQLYALGHPNST